MNKEQLEKDVESAKKALADVTDFVNSKEFYELPENKKNLHQVRKSSLETYIKTLCTELWGGEDVKIDMSSFLWAGLLGNMFTGNGLFASMPTTGTLNADLIKAGVISDVNGNSTIDMATGIAKLYQLIVERDLTIKDQNDVTKAFISTASGDVVLRLYDSTGTDYIVRLEQNDNRGLLHLTGDESELRLIDSNNDTIGMLYIKSSGDGRLLLKDHNGNITVDLDGGQGRVKATNAFDEVYSGSLSTVGASWTFMSDFAGLLVVGKVKSGGSEVTNIIPTKMITTTPTRFQLADETNWISFDVFVNANDLIEVQIAAKSSTGVIERVYGMF